MIKQPVAIIPNGIDIPALTDEKKTVRRTLLFLGRIHPIKGLENLLHAWSKLEQDFSDWDLQITGPGDAHYIANLVNLISQLGLTRTTLSEGVKGAAKLEAYQASQLYILPSQSENFAMTIAESLSCAVPVICTNGAPWSGVVKNKCGWWVEPSVSSLESTLRMALNKTTGELNEMGENGRQWMKQDFSWTEIARQMKANVYQPALAGTEMSSPIKID